MRTTPSTPKRSRRLDGHARARPHHARSQRMKGLKNKIVVVTGGAGGIGTAISKRFGEEGSIVALFDLNTEAGARVAAEIESAGGTARAYRVDITDQETGNGAVAAGEEESG